MPYLIDGHNLIPKLGLRLDSLDDEMELVAILQEFCRLERRQVDVFFDGAPSSQAGTRKLGAVTANFSPFGSSADNAIRNRLKKLGKAAKKLDRRFLRPRGAIQCARNASRGRFIR